MISLICHDSSEVAVRSQWGFVQNYPQIQWFIIIGIFWWPSCFWLPYFWFNTTHWPFLLRPQTFLARLCHTVQSTYLHQWVSRPFLRRTVGHDSTSKFKDFLPTKVRKFIKNWQLWPEIGAFDWTVDVPCEVRKGRITRWSPLQSCKVLPTASWNHAATFVSFLKRVHGLEYNLDISLISFA